MLSLRFVVPVAVLGVSLVTAVLPSLTSAADDPPAVTIHEGADPTTWGYTPASLTVAVGQTVTWTNSGTFPHDASSTDGSWKTPLLNNGASASVTFSNPGTYAYICSPHPWMQGTIVVTAAASPATSPTDVPPSPTVVSAPAPVAPTADVPPSDNTQPADSSATSPDTADGN
jgi:plastocyanin